MYIVSNPPAPSQPYFPAYLDIKCSKESKINYRKTIEPINGAAAVLLYLIIESDTTLTTIYVCRHIVNELSNDRDNINKNCKYIELHLQLLEGSKNKYFVRE